MKIDNIKGFKKVAHAIFRLKEQRKKDHKMSIAFVYTAPHAVHVHEDLEATHPNGGQAKFLEQPWREHNKEIKMKARELMKVKKMTLRQTLLEAGKWFLDTYSKPLVPVDTGELVNSGQVKVATH